MSRTIISIILGLFLGIGLIINPVSAEPNTYLYILNFENVQNDVPTDWLRQGFADKLREALADQKYLHLKNANDLEKIMDDRSRMLSQPRGSKNLLILGKYDRALDELIVNIQLINIATWEEVGLKQVNGNYTELQSLMDNIDQMILEMLKPFLPEDIPLKRPYPDLRVEIKPTPKPSVLTRTSSVAKNIDSAIEDLEKSMDIAIGAREENSEQDMDVAGEWSLDLNVDHEEEVNPENDLNTDMLVEVIESLLKNPYNVKMTPPRFEYYVEDDSTMKVIFHVEYVLKETILKDMLYSIPYTGLKQDGTLTIFVFNKEKFNFPKYLVDKLKYGTYRKVPVIRFVDQKEHPVVVIADTPDYTIYNQQADRFKLVPVHHFSPLVDITVGGWEINIAMETVAINVDYTFDIPVNQIDRLEGVRIKFIPATELSDYLNHL